MFEIERESAQPYYQQLKDTLRQRIATGDFKPGKAIPHEEDLAANLGISRMTVHRAMIELAQEGLLERIRGKGTFVRGSFSPQSARKTTIALINDGGPAILSCKFYAKIFSGIFSGAGDGNFQFTFRPVSAPHDAFVSSLRMDPTLKALILVGITDETLLRQFAKLKIPMVLVDGEQPGAETFFDEVTHNGESGVYDAVNSLIYLGHKDIALMESRFDNAIHRARRTGFERAMTAHGVPLRPELLCKVPGFEEAAYGAMRQLLHGPHAPSAIVCTMDEMILGVFAAITEHGWRVPHDISVVGYGDLGTYTHPLLSAVRVPAEQMGAATIDLLKERFKHPTAPRRRLVLPTEWIPRGTSACPHSRSITTGAPDSGVAEEQRTST